MTHFSLLGELFL